MKLSLSKRGDYTIRAALSLGRAFEGGSLRKIREVAEEMVLPPRYTPQILGRLAKAGLAEARAGRDGGFRLSRSPAEISLLELVEAAEGPLQTNECTLRGGPCHWDDMCAVHPAWVAAAQALRDSLSAISLHDLLTVDRDLRTALPATTPRRRKRHA